MDGWIIAAVISAFVAGLTMGLIYAVYRGDQQWLKGVKMCLESWKKSEERRQNGK